MSRRPPPDTTPFRDELRSCRDRLYYASPHRTVELALEITGRWLDRDDAEDLWRDLKSALPASFEITPVQFIAQVIDRRAQAGRAAEILAKGPRLVEKAKRKLKRDIARDDFAAVHETSGVLDIYKMLRARNLSREKGAERTWFMWSWSESFKMVCGRPLDELVAAITEIAFDLKDIGVDHVRAAQRTMRGVREKRVTRPPK